MHGETKSDLLQNGLALHQAGRLIEAEAIYQSVLKEQPRHPDALHLLGFVALQMGKNEIAVNLIEKAIKVNPKVPDFYYNCGKAYRAISNFELAIIRYEQALAIKPDYAEAHNNLGIALQELGRQEDALAHYEQALAIKSDFAEAHNNMGNALRELGRPEDAIACYEKALVIKPDYAEAHNNNGITLKELDRLEEAINHYEQAFTIKPDYAEAHNNMGNALKELGRLEEAITHYEQAFAIKPDYAEAHNNMGNVLQESGQPEDAINHYEQALAIKPDYAEAHNNWGYALKRLDRLDRLGLEDALVHFKQALTIKPDYIEAHNGMGNSLVILDRTEDAIAHYEQALAIQPDDAETHNNLGNAHQQLGQLKDAISHYERSLAIKPEFAKAHRNLSMINPEQEQASIIEELLSNPTVPEKDAMHYHFALGNLYNDAKSYTKAFEHSLKANSLRRKSITYDSQNHSIYVDKLISSYSKHYFQEKAAFGSDSELPVFIVGMPRSGTTLTEQIVSSHPQVYGAGELISFSRFGSDIAKQFEASSPYPECLSLLDSFMANKFSEKYLKELDGYSQNAKRITDKMPGNYFNIGLIKTLFPKARIIHCKRNALDTCTSIFSLCFPQGHHYSFDMTELGQHYLDYERLMAHWCSLFPDEIFDVQYEELVANQETVSRQLIEHLGLEWDEKCLEFDKNKRAIRTASNLQVRKPIYKNSINRWKRYEKQLGPLIEILKHHT